jgi:hypothetical protein
MKFTNMGLVEHAKKAVREQWHYGYGTFGERATRTVINRIVTQYPNQNARFESFLIIAAAKPYRLCDCYGLVKSFVWWNGDNADPLYNRYGLIDRNTTSAYKAATEKGKINTLPEIPGLILWKQGHVGVYIGSGEFVELPDVGLTARLRKVKDAGFTDWFMDTWITYPQTVTPFVPTVAPTTVITSALKPVTVGSVVTVNQGAVYGGLTAARGKVVPNTQLFPKRHTVNAVQINGGVLEARLKEIVSWVAVSSLTVI